MKSPNVIESLEPRRMLATFTGTSGNDTIDIFNWAGGGMNVRINGANNITTETSITVNGGVGNDTFNVSGSRSGTTVLARGESGNDTLINPSVEDLDAVYVAAFTFDGGTGTDMVVADNSTDTHTGYQMTVRGSAIIKSIGGTLIEYGGVESLEYRDNEGSNLIAFNDMHTSFSNVALEIYGNGGNDTIFNTSNVDSTGGSWDEAIGSGGVLIDGGTGTDTLLLKSTHTTTNVYQFIGNSINGSAFPGSGTGLLSYLNLETIDFVGGGHNETVAVQSKASGTALRANGGGGNDTFTVGNNDLDDSGILLSGTTLLGGAGTDSFTVQDSFDTDSAGETENYSWNSTNFTKGSAGFTYSEFESQTLRAANGTVSGFNTVPVVNLNSISTTITQSTVVGGSARGCSVSVGNGDLNPINGTLFLNLGGAALDTVNFNAQNTTGDVLYQLDATQLLLPRVVNYSGVKFFNINAGSGNDAFFINGTPAGMALQVNAASGNDNITVATGNVDANLLGPVTFNGAAGVNAATVNNTTDSSPESQTLNGTTFIDGFHHTFNGVSDLRINNGPGGTVLAVNSVSVRTSINGGNASDHFDVGGGDIDANIVPSVATFAALLIDGNGGNDSIRFNDFNDAVANSDSYIFQQTNGIDQFRRLDTTDVFVSWVDIEGVTLDQSNAPQVGNLFSGTFVHLIATPLRINGNGGLDSMQVEDSATPVFVNTGFGDRDNLSINSDGDAILATVVIDEDDDIENLTVSPGGTLRITSNAVVAKTRLGLNPSLDISGVLDLAGGAFLSRAGGPTLDVFQTRLARGYNAGAWNGTHASGAINSSLATATALPDGIGYALGSEIAMATIGPFTIAAGDTLMRYTFYGDADLNGVVDFDDYARTDAGFNNNRTGWVNGDYDYNDVIDFDDYSLIDQAFNTQGSPPELQRHN